MYITIAVSGINLKDEVLYRSKLVTDVQLTPKSQACPQYKLKILITLTKGDIYQKVYYFICW